MPDRALLDDEVDELNIRLNKNSGSFDYDMLADLWEPDFLVDCGFSPEDLFSDPEPSEKRKKDSEEKKSTKECPICGHQL